MGEQVIAKTIRIPKTDWAEFETLRHAHHTSLSGAVRIIVDHWRQTRDPGDSKQMARLRELAESYLREKITDNEFATEAGILILVGDH